MCRCSNVIIILIFKLVNYSFHYENNLDICDQLYIFDESFTSDYIIQYCGRCPPYSYLYFSWTILSQKNWPIFEAGMGTIKATKNHTGVYQQNMQNSSFHYNLYENSSRFCSYCTCIITTSNTQVHGTLFHDCRHPLF